MPIYIKKRRTEEPFICSSRSQSLNSRGNDQLETSKTRMALIQLMKYSMSSITQMEKNTKATEQKGPSNLQVIKE